MRAIALPDWGHELQTPDGRSLRVPADIFPVLRRLGLLVNNKPRLKPEIHLYLKPDYDCLAWGMRQLLGADLTGPAWCLCGCRQCRERASSDHEKQTPVEAHKEVDRIVCEIKAKRRYR